MVGRGRRVVIHLPAASAGDGEAASPGVAALHIASLGMDSMAPTHISRHPGASGMLALFRVWRGVTLCVWSCLPPGEGEVSLRTVAGVLLRLITCGS